MVRQRSARVAWLVVVVVLCSPVLVAARPDIIFHVPEVLVRHAAVPRPVGTGRSNATRHVNETEPWTSQDGLVQQRYEYYVEHEISTADAKKAAQLLKLNEYKDPDQFVFNKELHLVEKGGVPVGCGVCSRRDLEYCETKVVADHCCCDQRYVREPFPWMPHTCYIGPERCIPLADNCVLYTRIRDCCCRQKLATRWKGILSKSGRLGASGLFLMLLSVVMFTVYL